MTLEAIIPSSLEGYRLDQALIYLFPDYSRTYFQEQILQGRVQLQGQIITRTKAKVCTGQTVYIEPYTQPVIHESWQAEPITLDIIYEDEALLIINKPPNLVVHPAPGHPNHTLVNALLHHYPILEQLPRAGIIHRLDRDTSGLLVVPKTLTAHTTLVRQLASRQMKRHYYAIVKGVLLTGGCIDAPIGRHPILRQKQAVTQLHGKQAITHYRVLERFTHHSLLNVQLETGRTHQIRVHMAHIHHSILGDPVYGTNTYPATTKKKLSLNLAETIRAFPRQALHAHTLSFEHPLTQKWSTWEAPLPDDMITLLTALRSERNIFNQSK